MRRFVILLVGVLLLFSGGCGTQDGASDGGANSVTVGAIQLTSNSSTITTNDSATITARLLSSSGQLVSGATTVTFSLDNPALASMVGSATSSNGVVSLPLSAGAVEGVVVVTATADTASADLTIQISNDIAASTVTATANPANITVGGTSVVSATVLDVNGQPMPDGTTVNFSLNNTDLGTVVTSASITGGSGVAQATFSAGATTTGTAVVSVTSGSASGSTTVNVAGAAAGSIEFVSATPQIIVIKGSGGLETSRVDFLVKDANGAPVLGSQTVQFQLSGPNGGEYIGSTPDTTTLDVGTVSGVASVTLHSGSIPGTSTIIATVAGTQLSSSSGVIAIGGGIPSEGHFSLSTSTKNLEALAYDGITADITARIADRYGNYNVLAGTSVSFYSECGAIDRAVNLSDIGEGTVVFRTQTPRSEDVLMNSDDQDYALVISTKFGEVITDENNPRDGLCTITAVVDGEEEFTDANANGEYDSSESFVDTYDDIHIEKDDDIDNLGYLQDVPGNPFDSSFEDLVVDRNLNGQFDGINNEWDSNKRILQRINLLMTGIPGISISRDSVVLSNGERVTVYFSIHDANYNPPIAGTTFTVTTDVGGVVGQTEHTYLDTSVPGAEIFSVDVFDADPDTAEKKIGFLKFTWTWKGAEYTSSIELTVN